MARVHWSLLFLYLSLYINFIQKKNKERYAHIWTNTEHKLFQYLRFIFLIYLFKLYWTRTRFYSYIGHSVNNNTRIKLNCFFLPTILFVFVVCSLCSQCFTSCSIRESIVIKQKLLVFLLVFFDILVSRAYSVSPADSLYQWKGKKKWN